MYHRIDFWQGGTEAAESGARSDFKLALIALSQKIPATTRLMRVRIVPVDPGTGFALHDLVSIFIAFRVEEFQFVAGGLLAGARTVHHPGVEFRDAPLSS
jgi:hypothetical protein